MGSVLADVCVDFTIVFNADVRDSEVMLLDLGYLSFHAVHNALLLFWTCNIEKAVCDHLYDFILFSDLLISNYTNHSILETRLGCIQQTPNLGPLCETCIPLEHLV